MIMNLNKPPRMQKALADTLLHWNDLTFSPTGSFLGDRQPSPGFSGIVGLVGWFPILLSIKNRDGLGEGEACLCAIVCGHACVGRR